jgi:hypothetical protein
VPPFSKQASAKACTRWVKRRDGPISEKKARTASRVAPSRLRYRANKKAEVVAMMKRALAGIGSFVFGGSADKFIREEIVFRLPKEHAMCTAVK